MITPILQARKLRILEFKQRASTRQSRIQTQVIPSAKSVLNHNVILPLPSLPEASLCPPLNTEFKGAVLWSACAKHLPRSLEGQGFPKWYPVSPGLGPSPPKPRASSLSVVPDSPGQGFGVGCPSSGASEMVRRGYCEEGESRGFSLET